ncbi:MAG: T9SS type A sorting domain-containing protein, partial [Bacteroidota bacterium]
TGYGTNNTMKLSIHDITGREIQQLDVDNLTENEDHIMLNVSNLSSGIYHLHAHDLNGLLIGMVRFRVDK